jgi:predicted ArsR family transcriptional regulator
MDVRRGPVALARLLDALGEPTRRRIYEAVRVARRPLSRAEVADVVGTSTRLAAFHLDRLVEGGLLVAHFARPPGRRGGPGAGRPAKWYTPAAEGLEVTLPPRRNDIAARILLRAMVEAAENGGSAVTAVQAVARQTGAELARDCDGDAELDALLVDLGYEPTAVTEGGLDLVNCPFHELVNEDRQAVCSMNFAMLDAAATQAHSARVTRLEPRDGLCCVRLTSEGPPDPPI